MDGHCPYLADDAVADINGQHTGTTQIIDVAPYPICVFTRSPTAAALASIRIIQADTPQAAVAAVDAARADRRLRPGRPAARLDRRVDGHRQPARSTRCPRAPSRSSPSPTSSSRSRAGRWCIDRPVANLRSVDAAAPAASCASAGIRSTAPWQDGSP